MLHHNSILNELLKPLKRRAFDAIADRHDGNRYVKSMSTWTHLTAMIYAQLSPARSLRGVVAGWNANGQCHYHLGAERVRRSTLADANVRRSPKIFAETFSHLSGLCDRRLRREGGDVIRIIDSSPIPVSDLCQWAQWNGRTKGLKLHVVFDPGADHPRLAQITSATVNDVNVGRESPLELGATYVFDKAYADYAWWTRMHEADCRFVTRPKGNVHFDVIKKTALKLEGDGYTVLEDARVKHRTSGHTKLAFEMRRITVRRHRSKAKMIIVTNDLERSATEIAALYKKRWQIELLFRWIKQNLEIKSFLGRSENAISIQVIVAMIVYLLLRIAAKIHASKLKPVRLAELIGSHLFARKSITHIDKPPENRYRQYDHPNQGVFDYV